MSSSEDDDELDAWPSPESALLSSGGHIESAHCVSASLDARFEVDEDGSDEEW